MREIDTLALAGLLHDIGKFGQRAEIYAKKDSIYKDRDYNYTHGAYTAQILNELGFNLGDELSDDASMHHNPENKNQWIIAAADRMASGFEREVFEKYNAEDRESFKEQRLWSLFDESKRYKIDTLNPHSIFTTNEKINKSEYNELWKKFVEDFKQIKKHGNDTTDFFTIDYLMKKFTTFIPSSTSFQKGGYEAVKANIPLYEHSKATAVFTATLEKLAQVGNENIINYYKDKSGDINQQDLLMISGDFFGIQKFIFDDLAVKNAAKILRAKSAYIQILTKVVAFKVVERLGLSYLSIISTNAGKFEILGINDEHSKKELEQIQKELNTFFTQNYFGETGIGISFTEASLGDFIVTNRYKEKLRKRVANAVEIKKFKKFDLQNVSSILATGDDIDNQTLCPLCKKRKIVENERCITCKDFVTIGEKLAKSNYLILSKEKGQIHIIGDFYLSFADEAKVYKNHDIAVFDISNTKDFNGYAKWELASYVKKGANSEVVSFEDLAKQSVKIGLKDGKREHGIEAIMSLKGDVDSMGAFLKKPQNELSNSFARFNFFSRMMDYFFSVYATKLMEGRDIYTVFAGGDDIFILGAWDEVIEFAKELREKFMLFCDGSTLSISMGLILTKPSKPIKFVADLAEEALEEAKAIDSKKDAISLFGETVKWDDYLDDNGLMSDLKIVDDNTAFLYRLLEFVQMSKKVKFEADVQSTIWRSKLNYSFARNMDLKDENHIRLLSNLDRMIEKYPEETKMFLSEFIYKRRG